MDLVIDSVRNEDFDGRIGAIESELALREVLKAEGLTIAAASAS